MAREAMKIQLPPEWVERKKKHLCPVCGKTPEEFDKHRKVYCSEECADKWAEHYCTWNELRDRKIKNSPQCAICGITEEKWKQERGDTLAKQYKNAEELYAKEIVAEKLKKIARLEQQYIREIEEIENATVATAYWLRSFLREACEAKLENEWHYFFGFELDHIIPISKGGAMWDDKNLQVICKECHAKKTKKDLTRIEDKKLGVECGKKEKKGEGKCSAALTKN